MRLKEESLRQLPPTLHSANNSNKKRYPDRWKSRCDFSSSSTCLWPVHCLLVLQTTTTETVGEEAGNHGSHIDTNSCNSLFIQPPLYFQVWICCTKRWLSRHLNRKGAAVKTEKGRKRRPCLSLSFSFSLTHFMYVCVFRYMCGHVECEPPTCSFAERLIWLANPWGTSNTNIGIINTVQYISFFLKGFFLKKKNNLSLFLSTRLSRVVVEGNYFCISLFNTLLPKC